MESTLKEFRIGILGAGGFSRFSIDAFLKVQGVSVSGVYDTDKNQSGSFADKYSCRVFEKEQELLEDDSTDIIYISTPPFLHFQNSKDCLLAGKHVICEKPAALRVGEVEELINIAKSKDLLYVVNLMQRYNPLFPQIKELIDQNLLGDFLHGYFENYASDESLNPEHWMWDENKSGGIFIEHAVHFFDLIEGWLGKGELLSAQKLKRKGIKKDIWPEVQAICKYRNGLFNFYHGFHQANRMDRQELKLVFETGEITLLEWVPSQLTLKALVTKKTSKAIEAIFPTGKLMIIKSFKGEDKNFRSHSENRQADYLIQLEVGDKDLKYSIYEQLLTDMIADQIEWLKDRNHLRRISDTNALNSTGMAEKANHEAILI